MPSAGPSASRTAWPSVMPTSSTVWCVSTCEIALGGEPQIEQAVLRERLEHVVEEGEPGRDLVLAAAVEVDRDPHLGLARLALDRGLALACARS